MLKRVKVFIALASILMMITCISACVPQQARNSAHDSSKIITGGFGYNFGEILDKSRIMEVSYVPSLDAEGYVVNPKIKNRDIDYCVVEICKRTKIIYNITGFKVFNSKAEAIKHLNGFRPIVEAKYGKLHILPVENGLHIESVNYGAYEVVLMAMPAAFIPPKWSFSILYISKEHLRSCKSLF